MFFSFFSLYPKFRRLLPGMLLLGNASCDHSGFDIGSGWVTASTRTVVIDTCTVQLSNVRLDSIPTSAGEWILTGIYEDRYFGKTSLKSFLTFQTAGGFNRYDDMDSKVRLSFDSLTLVLRPDSLYRGDTLSPMTLNVHRLSEQVELDDEGYLYGHSSFAYDPAPTATHRFFPRPASGETVEIRLPDAWGKDFLEKLRNRSDEVSGNEDFAEYFNGLVLVPGEETRTILGFRAADTTCCMRLYYHIVTDLSREAYTDFALDASLQFNATEFDRAGTPIGNRLDERKEVAATQTGHLAFIQGMAGIYTKIEFPYLNNILELGDHGNIEAAYLLIYPVRESYGKHAPLPEKLQMYISNELNVTTGAITGQNEEMQGGDLSVDEVFHEETFYRYDVTSFLKNQLGKFGIYKQNLQLIVPDYGYTLDNLVVADRQHGENPVRLTILYSIYDEK